MQTTNNIPIILTINMCIYINKKKKIKSFFPMMVYKIKHLKAKVAYQL